MNLNFKSIDRMSQAEPNGYIATVVTETTFDSFVFQLDRYISAQRMTNFLNHSSVFNFGTGIESICIHQVVNGKRFPLDCW